MRRIVRLLAVLAFTVIAREQARADLIIVLSPATLTGNPGDALHFGGSLTNTGGTVVFLNGISLTGNSGFFFNTNPFFVNAPVSLAPAGIYTGPFFDLIVLPGTASGLYNGSFAVLGGSTALATNVLGSQTYSAQVGPVSTAPEPSAFVLLISGVPVLVFLARRTSSRLYRL